MLKQIFGSFSKNGNTPLSRISQANSCISLDPFTGCPLDCAYCYRHNCERDTNEIIPHRIFSDEQIVEALVKHPYFVSDKTVISIGTGSTDPFLEQTKESTFNIMDLIQDKGLRNPFWIVTKKGIPKGYDKRFASITKKSKGIVVSISYSGMPSKIEPYQSNRFTNLKSTKAAGVKLSLHFRPIIPTWNDAQANIKQVLEKSDEFDCICIGGLRFLEGIKYSIVKLHGLEFPKIPENKLQKELSKETQQTIFRIAKTLKIKIPIFLNSSCAISYLLGSGDYNATFIRDTNSCLTSTCPKYQRKKCNFLKNNLIGNQTPILKKIGIKGKLVISPNRFKFSEKIGYVKKMVCIHQSTFNSGAFD
ncbi:MAG: hypothetical protein Q7S21_02625 [archaeon]|nr:hypothetical protein [archaeon]